MLCFQERLYNLEAFASNEEKLSKYSEIARYESMKGLLQEMQILGFDIGKIHS